MRSEVPAVVRAAGRRSGRGGISALLLFGAGAILSPDLAAASQSPTVAIVRSSRVGPFDEAVAAIVDALRKDPVQPEILTFDLAGERANVEPVLRRTREADPRLIITVGSLATKAVLEGSFDADVPLVFSMVLYPGASGFLEKRERGVTGASLDIPFGVQFDTLHRLLPDARRVGVLYSPEETGSVVAAAAEAATRHGLHLVTEPVDGASRALAALDALMERADAIWTVADSHVFTAETTPALLLAALRRRVPVVGLSVGQVRSGALAALVVDYADVGRQTAELASRVLHGAGASELPVTVPQRVSLALNLKTATLLGLRIPSDLEAEAREVIR